MLIYISKVLFAALIISFASWLSFKKPVLSGFIIALPLTSILAIMFSYIEHKDIEKTITFSKSILTAIPLSLLFFLPFFFAKNLNLTFWPVFFLGLLFLFFGYLVHKFIGNFL